LTVLPYAIANNLPRGIPPPPIQKPYPEEAKRIALSQYDQFTGLGRFDLESAIKKLPRQQPPALSSRGVRNR